MNWDAIGAAGEWFGAIAVVATLFYLAIQIRQNTNSIRGQTEMDYTKETIAWVARISADPELQEIWQKGVAGETMTSAERSRYMWFNTEWFYLCEGMYRQYKRGLLDEAAWQTLADALVTFIVEDDILRDWWDSGASIFSQDYKDALNAHRQIHRPKWNRAEASARLINTLKGK